MNHYLFIADRFHFFAFLFSLFGATVHCIGILNCYFWTPIEQHELVAEMLGFCLGTILLFVFTECIVLEYTDRWCKMFLWGNRSVFFLFNDGKCIRQVEKSLALASHLFQVSPTELRTGQIPPSAGRWEIMRGTILTFLLLESIVLPFEYWKAVLSRTKDVIRVIPTSFMHTPGLSFFHFVLCSSFLVFLFCLSRIVIRPSLRWIFLLGAKGRKILFHQEKISP